jgi:hypothetical protein
MSGEGETASKILAFSIPLRSYFYVFVKKYRFHLVILLILSVLLLYSLAHEKLFEFLLLIVTWLQLELAYRQWWLDRVTKKPHFQASIPRLSANLYLYIKNVGSVPAYTVRIASILDAQNWSPLDPKEWEKYIETKFVNLAPGERELLAIISPKFLEKNREGIILEIHYNDPTELGFLLSSAQVLLKCSDGEWRAYIFEYNECKGFLTEIPNIIRNLYFIILALKNRVKRIQYKMILTTLSVILAAICSAIFFVLRRNWIMSPLPLLGTLACFIQVMYVPLSLASLAVSLALLLYAFYLRAKVFKLVRETNE